MKNINLKKSSFLIIVCVALFSIAPATETKAQAVTVNFSLFQQELSPYGRWMSNPRFGQVWIYNDVNFKPYYTNGHWEYTNYGWSWESDYDWGWAPFHYGRWEFDNFYGWMWIPGYEWGSAWVRWSSYDDYYGWAPLGYGVSINVSFGSIAFNHWNFVPRRNICERNLSGYYIPYQQNQRFRNAVVINNYYYGRGGVGNFVRGPQRRDVERYTHNRVQERRIDYRDRNRGRNDNAGITNRRNGNNRGNADVSTGNGRNRTDRANNNNRWNSGVNGNQRQNTTRSDDGIQNTSPRNQRVRPVQNDRRRNNSTVTPGFENRRQRQSGISGSTPPENRNNVPNRSQRDSRINRNPERQRESTRPVPQQQPRQQRQVQRRADTDNGVGRSPSSGSGSPRQNSGKRQSRREN